MATAIKFRLFGDRGEGVSLEFSELVVLTSDKSAGHFGSCVTILFMLRISGLCESV